MDLGNLSPVITLMTTWKVVKKYGWMFLNDDHCSPHARLFVIRCASIFTSWPREPLSEWVIPFQDFSVSAPCPIGVHVLHFAHMAHVTPVFMMIIKMLLIFLLNYDNVCSPWHPFASEKSGNTDLSHHHHLQRVRRCVHAFDHILSSFWKSEFLSLFLELHRNNTRIWRIPHGTTPPSLKKEAQVDIVWRQMRACELSQSFSTWVTTTLSEMSQSSQFVAERCS